MISWENYEEYMIMHADGELQPAEEQELMAFVALHPELKSELAIYGRTHLVPDETIVYADKNSLLRPETATRIIAFPQWRRYAIAAGIAALLFLSFYKYRDIRNNGEVVKIDTAEKILPPPQQKSPIQSVPAPGQDIAAAPAHEEKEKPTALHEQNAVAAHNTKVKHATHDIKVANRQEPGIAHNNKARNIVPVQMEAVSFAEVSVVTNKPKTEPALSTIEVSAFSTAMTSNEESEDKRSFIDRLPIDESNKQQLKTLARIATGASKAKRQLSEKELTFRVEDNKLKISF